MTKPEKKVNVETGKQGFQPTVKSEASDFSLGSMAADGLNEFGHFTDAEFRAVRNIVASQFIEAAKYIGDDLPEVSRVEFRVVQDEPGMSGYRISDVTCYDNENLDLEDFEVEAAAYENLCSSLTNHTRSLLAEDTGIGVTDSDGVTEILIANPTERLC